MYCEWIDECEKVNNDGGSKEPAARAAQVIKLWQNPLIANIQKSVEFGFDPHHTTTYGLQNVSYLMLFSRICFSEEAQASMRLEPRRAARSRAAAGSAQPPAITTTTTTTTMTAAAAMMTTTTTTTSLAADSLVLRYPSAEPARGSRCLP